MLHDPMTAEEWAEHLTRKAKRTGLDADDLKLWLLMNCNDRLVEIQGKIEDLADRYQELDKWLEQTAPGYRARGRPAREIKDGEAARA